MGIPRQIPQDLLRATERELAVDYPFPVKEGGDELRKTDRVCKFSTPSTELQFSR
jgi:hypothetical protein